jgi:flagellar motor switch protein FliN/FliY
MVPGENMELLMDVPLSVSVELGKSKKFIKEIIDFNVGSIIVLDKMAGELVDVIVNGKLIAKGEVVVIDENYGVRITDIVSPSKRINS